MKAPQCKKKKKRLKKMATYFPFIFLFVRLKTKNLPFQQTTWKENFCIVTLKKEERKKVAKTFYIKLHTILYVC